MRVHERRVSDYVLATSAPSLTEAILPDRSQPLDAVASPSTDRVSCALIHTVPDAEPEQVVLLRRRVARDRARMHAQYVPSFAARFFTRKPAMVKPPSTAIVCPVM